MLLTEKQYKQILSKIKPKPFNWRRSFKLPENSIIDMNLLFLCHN